MARRAREPLYSLGMGIARAIFGFLRVKETVTGIDNLPDDGGAVLAMTHFGYLEFALVGWVIWLHDRRPIRFMATRGAFERPLIGAALRSAGQIPVDKRAGTDAYRHAIDALKAGELVGIFPEAGVDISYTVRPLKTGAVRLASEAGVPLIPIAVWGGQRLLTKNHRIRFFERFGVPVAFAIGEPVPVAGEAHVATSLLHARLQEMVAGLRESYPTPATGEWWQPRSLGGSAMSADDAAAWDAAFARRKAELRAAKGAAAAKSGHG